MDAFKLGQMVTILPPYDDDPIVVSMQPYARVAEVRGEAYMLVLGATWPPDELFGPFPLRRLVCGWRDPVDGDWWFKP
jgi:hypothetical protein